MKRKHIPDPSDRDGTPATARRIEVPAPQAGLLTPQAGQVLINGAHPVTPQAAAQPAQGAVHIVTPEAGQVLIAAHPATPPSPIQPMQIDDAPVAQNGVPAEEPFYPPGLAGFLTPPAAQENPQNADITPLQLFAADNYADEIETPNGAIAEPTTEEEGTGSEDDSALDPEDFNPLMTPMAQAPALNRNIHTGGTIDLDGIAATPSALINIANPFENDETGETSSESESGESSKDLEHPIEPMGDLDLTLFDYS